MKVSLQRVTEASAIVLNELGTPDPTFDMAQIGPGLVLTIEVEPDDDEGTLARMAHRVLTLRCFDGPQGRLSLSVQEMHGEILSIPQPLTTLRRSAVGRPQLVSHDAYDEHANLIWIRFNEALRSGNVPVREGRFGARHAHRFHRRRSLPIHIAGMTATLAGMDSKTLITLSRSIDAVCGIAVIEVTNSTRRARNIWQRVGWVSGGIAQEFPSGN